MGSCPRRADQRFYLHSKCRTVTQEGHKNGSWSGDKCQRESESCSYRRLHFLRSLSAPLDWIVWSHRWRVPFSFISRRDLCTSAPESDTAKPQCSTKIPQMLTESYHHEIWKPSTDASTPDRFKNSFSSISSIRLFLSEPHFVVQCKWEHSQI